MKRMSFFKKLMLFLNVIVAFSLFLACIVPYTSIASLAFISLAVPALVIVNMLFFLYWLIGKKIYLLLSLSILVFGYFTLGSFIAFNGRSNSVSDTNTISLLSYNALGFHSKYHGDWENITSPEVIEFVEGENPDIIYFQEFEPHYVKGDMLKSYPFKANKFEVKDGESSKNLAIFSKFKIINNGELDFPNTFNGGVYADIVFKKDTIRFYNLHLESLSIRPGYIKKERSDKLFVRLRDSFDKQERQSDIVKEHIKTSPYPVIVGGDFNNTQFSKVYFNIKGELKDSFLEAGHGYGETIKFWKFPFRIDMILGDSSFTFLSHDNYSINISDHEPIMATFKLSE
ncbi:endonuclease/exonuclease/phosphatase family protein [Maribacter sp. SA7]|uniref:endonuclease/exonuclease/phosphatase family protein n=1 Tax=Maribacter zhoushanensis TaxID=3030012 RepID=UPI0023ECCC3C|nr:endonuclease/exonuclease/phosphatase family protein [Maribacter zhoushanensis]MDF4204195.1 endonuclease/exonuclease/phosphatase family protein [Maribacter zhoushanensis]